MLKSRVIACAAASLAAIVIAPVIADDDVATRLATCQAVAGESDRLACYDELAASTELIAAPAAAAVATPAATPAPLSDDIGKEQVKGAKVKSPEYAGVVTRCEKAKLEERTFFYMENGQIWRQSNAGRLPFKTKDCQFDVTIKKDALSWIMYVAGEDRKIRVKRIR